MNKPQTKKELAEAGRRKLEAFRRQKAEKKQPSKAVVPDEPANEAAGFSKPNDAVPEPVSLPPSSKAPLAEQNGDSGSGLAQSTQSGQPYDRTASSTSTAPALGPPAAHIQHIQQSSTELAPEPAASAAESAQNAAQQEQSQSVLKPRTARSLFSAGLPTPPPLPLPPTPNSRPAWMNGSMSRTPVQPPVTAGGTASALTDSAEGAPGVSSAYPPAASKATPAKAVVAAISLAPRNDTFIGAAYGPELSAHPSEEQCHSASTALQAKEELSSSALPMTKGQGSDVAAHESPQVKIEQAELAPSKTFEMGNLDASAAAPDTFHLGSTQSCDVSSGEQADAGNEDEDDSWQALLARPVVSEPSQHPPARKEPISSPGLLGTPKQLPGTPPAAPTAAKAPQYSSSGAEGSVNLSDMYATSKQLGSEEPSLASPAAASYARLSDDYLGVSTTSALSGPPPSAHGALSHQDASGSHTASSRGYAAPSDSHLLPPSLEHRMSGALPVSSKAAMGPPSHSTLDPIEQRQLGALPVSSSSVMDPPSRVFPDTFQQRQLSSFQPPASLSSGPPSSDAYRGTADTGPAPFRSGPGSQPDELHSASAGLRSSLWGASGDRSSVGEWGRASPSKTWGEPGGPPPSSYQMPPSSFQRQAWSTADSDRAFLNQPRRTSQDSNGPMLADMTNGASKPSDLSNGHARDADLQKSSSGNGMPPLGPQRSWSRDTWEARANAAPSPPVSVRGTASEEGFATSEGQMRRFKALQQHIDELTHEKYELIRGLAMQRKVQESLEAESERFADDFNRQAQHAQALQAQLDQLSAEVAAQRLALAAATSERDGARASAIETNERLRRLAAEVVELEEKALKARSEELKREREAAAEREAAKRAQAAATAALQEREALQSILDTLEEEKRAMQLKLRRAALGEHLREEQGTKEASTQTELGPKEAQTPSPFRSQASVQTPRQRAESVLLTQAEEDPSVRLTSEAMKAFNAQSGEVTGPAELPEALLQLLPKTLYRGGLAGQESDVAADEAAALSNIHGLLDTLERQQRSILASLDAKEAEARKLAAANRDLSQRLESAQQRLELAVSRSQHASAQPQRAASLVMPGSKARDAQGGAGRELVAQSAPITPAQPSQQLLRAPKEEARKGALGRFVDFLVPPAQEFRPIGPLT